MISTLARTALAAVLLAGGCTGATEDRGERVVVDAPVDEIRIEGGSGSVRVETGSGPNIEMDVTVTAPGDPPASQHSLDGSALVLQTGCGQSCSIDYSVTAPAEITVVGTNGSGDIAVAGVRSVDVATGSGALDVEGVEQDVRASSRSGRIELRDLDGDVTATSGSGQITGSGLRGRVEVEAASGDVELTLTEPADVSIATRSGNVTLAVPDAAYAIDTSSTSGRIEAAMRSDPNGAHRLQVRTGSGDIAVGR